MLKSSVQAEVKGMFVGNANNSTNSISKALGVFILFSWTRKKVGSDGVCLSVYVNVACLLQFINEYKSHTAQDKSLHCQPF